MSQIVKTHRQPIYTGSEVMVGATAVVVNDFETAGSGYAGHVRMHGELWSGISRGPLKEGDHVRIVSREGLRLYVEPEGGET
jgi:membrane-bound serine protease (ClpP class)